MRGGRIRQQGHDRALVIALAVLLAFGLMRLAGARPESFMSAQGTLGSAYLAFVGSNQATYLYVPLFAFCAARFFRPLSSAMWLARSAGRAAALARLLPGLVARALAFSAAVLAPSLAALVLRSSLAPSPGQVVGFCLVQLAFETAFFVICGLVYATSRLLTRSGALSLVLTVVYGASDTFVSSFDRAHDGTLWMGWMLMGQGDPSSPVVALAGMLRLIALAALLYLIARRAVRSLDLLEAEPHHDAA